MLTRLIQIRNRKCHWNRYGTNLRNKNKADEVSGTFYEKRWFGESGIDRKD